MFGNTNACNKNIPDYAPVDKTSEMTQSVGKDSSGKLWTAPVSTQEIIDATETWLDNNITQETGYVIDDSLSVSGAAADAKVVGDTKKTVEVLYNNSIVRMPSYGIKVAYGLTFESFGAQAKINGTATSASIFYFDKNNESVNANAGFGAGFVNNMSDLTKYSYDVVQGHRLKLSFRIISGSITRNDITYDANSTFITDANVIAAYLIKETPTTSDYTLGTKVKTGSMIYLSTVNKIGTVGIYIYKDAICNDLVIEFSLIDLDANTPSILDSLSKHNIESIVPYYEPSLTYNYGDYVKYGPLVYKCNITLKNPGAWNSTEWQEVTLSDELAYANKDITIPSYWKNELDASLQTLLSYTLSDDYSSPTLCIITDCHWGENKKISPNLVKYLIEHSNIDYFINLGDIVVGYNTDGMAAAAQELDDFINSFRNVGLPMVTCYGNHDRNREGNPESEDSTKVLSKKQHMNIVYKSWMKKINCVSLTSDHDCIYWDDQYYRYAITYWYKSESRETPWLDELFNTNKQVIVFNHGIYATMNEDMSTDTFHGAWLLEACKPYRTKIRCFIQGHVHREGLRWAYTDTDTKVPIISLDCDVFRSNRSIEGTITEQSFSLIKIDDIANSDAKIKVIKVGRGLDYEVSSTTDPFITMYNDYIPSNVICY